MRGSIPVLPVPLAWICLVLNVFLPGTGKIIKHLIKLKFTLSNIELVISTFTHFAGVTRP